FELLLREGASRERVNLVFFGGEPLTNVPLIRQVVEYAERRALEVEKTVDFTLTTNGTLLTEDLIAWFDAHRFGLTVSMDGPRSPRAIGCWNTPQRLSGVAHGTARARPCGAGVGMLAVGGGGCRALWRRATGASLRTFGTVAGGIDRARLGAFLEAAQYRAG